MIRIDGVISIAGFLGVRRRPSETDTPPVGVGEKDAVFAREGEGDLAIILKRHADGSVADGAVLTDVIEEAAATGGCGF